MSRVGPLLLINGPGAVILYMASDGSCDYIFLLPALYRKNILDSLLLINGPLFPSFYRKNIIASLTPPRKLHLVPSAPLST